jgi:hypothetical protein
MGFDFIYTIMFFGIGLETEKVITVKEQKSVRMFDVTISRSLDRQVTFEVIMIDNEIETIRDQEGEEISWFDYEDDDCEKQNDEWLMIENIVKEHLK